MCTLCTFCELKLSQVHNVDTSGKGHKTDVEPKKALGAIETVLK